MNSTHPVGSFLGGGGGCSQATGAAMGFLRFLGGVKWGVYMTPGSLRTADVFPVVASLPYFSEEERSNDRKYVCGS